MPVTVKRYRCKDCGCEYKSYQEAKQCEDGHPVPVSVKAVRYTVRPYPYQIEVVFNNGERHIYNADELGG